MKKSNFFKEGYYFLLLVMSVQVITTAQVKWDYLGPDGLPYKRITYYETPASEARIFAAEENSGRIVSWANDWQTYLVDAVVYGLGEGHSPALNYKTNNIKEGETNLFAVGSDLGFSLPKAFRWDGLEWIEISITGSGRLFGAAVYEQTVVFVGEGGTWRSTDGGINFQPGIGLFGGVDVIYNHIDNKWYAAGGAGIHSSLDGHTWGPPGEFVIVNKIAVHPTSGNMALATAFNEVKVLTIGGTLTTLSNGWPTNAWPSGVVYDDQGALYASYIIYGSPNISSTMKYNVSTNQWEDIGGVPNADINDIEYAEFDTESSFTASLFAATTDGVWRMDLVTDVEDEITNPDDFILHQNYPNPFNPSTTINWQSPVSSWQTLKVYDLLGKEVATLVDEYKPAGIYELEFNAEGLSSGMYFYKLQAEGLVQTKKMILLK